MFKLFRNRRHSEEKVDEMLSAYVDGALSSDEQATLEARLEKEPALRERLQGLRLTVEALANLEAVETPRNFILSPAMVAAPRPVPPRRRRPAWSALSWATTVATLLLLIVLAGDFFVYAPSLRQESEDQPWRQPEAIGDREAKVVEHVETESEVILPPTPEIALEKMEIPAAEAPAEEIAPAAEPVEAEETIPPPAALGTVEDEADAAQTSAEPATLAGAEPVPEGEQQNDVVTAPPPGATPEDSQRSLDLQETEEASVGAGYSPSMTQAAGTELYRETPSFKARGDEGETSAPVVVSTSSQETQGVPSWLRGIEVALGLVVVGLLVATLVARRRQQARH